MTRGNYRRVEDAVVADKDARANERVTALMLSTISGNSRRCISSIVTLNGLTLSWTNTVDLGAWETAADNSEACGMPRPIQRDYRQLQELGTFVRAMSVNLNAGGRCLPFSLYLNPAVH